MGSSEIRAIGGSGSEAALSLPRLEHVPELLRDLSPALASFSHPLLLSIACFICRTTLAGKVKGNGKDQP